MRLSSLFSHLLTEGPSAAPGDLLQEGPWSDVRGQDPQGSIGQDIAQGAKEAASAAATSGVIEKKQSVHRPFMICSDVGKGRKSFIRGTVSFISCVMYMDIGFAKVHHIELTCLVFLVYLVVVMVPTL